MPLPNLTPEQIQGLGAGLGPKPVTPAAPPMPNISQIDRAAGITRPPMLGQPTGPMGGFTGLMQGLPENLNFRPPAYEMPAAPAPQGPIPPSPVTSAEPPRRRKGKKKLSPRAQAASSLFDKLDTHELVPGEPIPVRQEMGPGFLEFNKLPQRIRKGIQFSQGEIPLGWKVDQLDRKELAILVPLLMEAQAEREAFERTQYGIQGEVPTTPPPVGGVR